MISKRHFAVSPGSLTLAALVGLGGIAPARAGIIVDTLGSSSPTALVGEPPPGTVAQDFVPGAGNGGEVASVSAVTVAPVTGLEIIDFALYATDPLSGVPTTLLAALGSDTYSATASTPMTVTLTSFTANYTMAVGTMYSLVMSSAPPNAFQYYPTSPGSSVPGGNLGIAFTSPDGILYSPISAGPPGAAFDMEIASVPEVSMTGWLIGGGALAIAAGHEWRRRRLAPNSIGMAGQPA